MPVLFPIQFLWSRLKSMEVRLRLFRKLVMFPMGKKAPKRIRDLMLQSSNGGMKGNRKVNVRCGLGINYKIPKHIFNKRTTKDKRARVDVNSAPGGKSAVSRESETVFAEHISNMFAIGFGLSPKDVIDLAIQNFPQLNNEDSASNWYYRGFLKRFPTIGSRKMDKLERNRAAAYSKESFLEYFNLISSTYEKVSALNGQAITPDIVFNLDETGHDPSKITKMLAVGRKASTQKKVTTSSSRCHISKLTTANAEGKLAPEYYLMKGERCKSGFTDEWLVEQGAPNGSRIFMTPRGGMNGDIWIKCVKRLAPAMRKMSPYLDGTEKNTILFLDGFDCHSMSIEALKIFREYRIFVIKMPSHSSGNLQALDVAFFSPEKTYVSQGVRLITRQYPGMVMDQWDLLNVVIVATVEVMKNPETIPNGFRKSNMFPNIPGEDWIVKNEDMFKLSTSFSETGFHPDPTLSKEDKLQFWINRRILDDPFAHPSQYLNLDLYPGQVKKIGPSPSACLLIQSLSAAEKRKIKKRSIKKTHNSIGELFDRAALLTTSERISKLTATKSIKDALKEQKLNKKLIMNRIIASLFKNGIRDSEKIDILGKSKPRKAEMQDLLTCLEIEYNKKDKVATLREMLVDALASQEDSDIDSGHAPSASASEEEHMDVDSLSVSEME